MQKYYKYKNWYSSISEKLKEKYANDFLLICALIASISPQMPVYRNLEIAENIYNDYKKDKEKFLKLLKNKTKFYKKYGLFKPHYNNIVKSIYHDFTLPLKLNGNKVYNFYLNLSGNYEAVTIDTWMLRFFKHPIEKMHYLSKKDYYIYAEKIKQDAKENGFLPCEWQAILWQKIRIESGQEAISFCDVLQEREFYF